MSRSWHDLVVPSRAAAREARDDPLRHAVAAVARDRHRHPVAVGCAERPRPDVVDGGVGGRRGRRRAPRLDDGRAALGDGRDERAVDPFVVTDRLVGVAPTHLAVEQVGVLRRRVVAPDRHPPDVGDRRAELLGDLRDRPVVVEPCHRREPTRVEVGCVRHRDQGVGVGRVADDEDLDVALGGTRQRRALRLEDPAVGRQQIGALHPRLARHRADEQCHVGVTERDVGVVGAHDVGEQREGAVVELHPHTLERTERRRDLEQLQGDGRVGPEHRAGGDAEQEGVADLAGGSGDGDAYRCCHRCPSVGPGARARQIPRTSEIRSA